MDQPDPSSIEGPPEDPEAWTDEQWLAWLQATDADAKAEEGRPPATTAGRVVHSTGGQVLGQTMIGIAQAIYGRQADKPVIVEQANSDPEKERPFGVELDPEHPERSTAYRKNDSDPSH